MQHCDCQRQKGPRFSENLPSGEVKGADRKQAEKKRERQPRPLTERPPRRRHEQHLAALPCGERPSTASCLKDPCGSVWRFSVKQFSTHFSLRQQVVTVADFFGHGLSSRFSLVVSGQGCLPGAMPVFNPIVYCGHRRTQEPASKEVPIRQARRPGKNPWPFPVFAVA